MSKNWMAELTGCTKGIRASDKKDITACALALMTCTAHEGRHHFAVIGDGKVLACSDIAVQCLKAQGVDLDAIVR